MNAASAGQDGNARIAPAGKLHAVVISYTHGFRLANQAAFQLVLHAALLQLLLAGAQGEHVLGEGVVAAGGLLQLGARGQHLALGAVHLVVAGRAHAAGALHIDRAALVLVVQRAVARVEQAQAVNPGVVQVVGIGQLHVHLDGLGLGQARPDVHVAQAGGVLHHPGLGHGIEHVAAVQEGVAVHVGPEQGAAVQGAVQAVPADEHGHLLGVLGVDGEVGVRLAVHAGLAAGAVGAHAGYLALVVGGGDVHAADNQQLGLAVLGAVEVRGRGHQLGAEVFVLSLVPAVSLVQQHFGQLAPGGGLPGAVGPGVLGLQQQTGHFGVGHEGDPLVVRRVHGQVVRRGLAQQKHVLAFPVVAGEVGEVVADLLVHAGEHVGYFRADQQPEGRVGLAGEQLAVLVRLRKGEAAAGHVHALVLTVLERAGIGRAVAHQGQVVTQGGSR